MTSWGTVLDLVWYALERVVCLWVSHPASVLPPRSESDSGSGAGGSVFAPACRWRILRALSIPLFGDGSITTARINGHHWALFCGTLIDIYLSGLNGNTKSEAATPSVPRHGSRRLPIIAASFLSTGSLELALRLDDGSRMSGDVHVRFCESLAVKSPRATHPSIVWLSGDRYNTARI